MPCCTALDITTTTASHLLAYLAVAAAATSACTVHFTTMLSHAIQLAMRAHATLQAVFHNVQQLQLPDVLVDFEQAMYERLHFFRHSSWECKAAIQDVVANELTGLAGQPERTAASVLQQHV
jgi:hypothetical protein